MVLEAARLAIDGFARSGPLIRVPLATAEEHEPPAPPVGWTMSGRSLGEAASDERELFQRGGA
jgi:hypothetical protein